MPAFENVESAVVAALNRLVDEDRFLLEDDANERSLSHRFAMYLQAVVDVWGEGWSVDCEYNRDADGGLLNPKLLNLPEFDVLHLRADDADATTVYPDVVVHHRRLAGEDGHNLLVVEMKKSTANDGGEGDVRRKLPAYVSQLHYQ